MSGKPKTIDFEHMTKRCARCHEYKPFIDFPKSNNRAKSGALGLQAYCRPCGTAKNAEWKKKNPDRRKEIAHRSYWKDPEKRRALKRLLSPEQRAIKNTAARAYRKKNADKVRWWNKLRLHRQRAAGEMLDKWDIGLMLCDQDARCTYCGSLLETQYHIDHKTPVSRGGRNDAENIQLLCPTCNMKKGAKTHQEYVWQLMGVLL